MAPLYSLCSVGNREWVTQLRTQLRKRRVTRLGEFRVPYSHP